MGRRARYGCAAWVMARAIAALLAAVRVAAAQDPTPLTLDVAVSDSIDALGAGDRYTFSLATSERVVLQATGPRASWIPASVC